MMNQKIRRMLGHIAARESSAKAGKFGHECARRWFQHHNYEHYEFPQGKYEKPRSLAAVGGKRPDFLVAIGEVEPHLYVDAKYHSTKELTEFVLSEAEIREYEQFRAWALDELQDGTSRYVVFMLYPKELNGDKFVWIDLNEFSNCEAAEMDGEPARRLSLVGRDAELWEDGC